MCAYIHIYIYRHFRKFIKMECKVNLFWCKIFEILHSFHTVFSVKFCSALLPVSMESKGSGHSGSRQLLSASIDAGISKGLWEMRLSSKFILGTKIRGI